MYGRAPWGAAPWAADRRAVGPAIPPPKVIYRTLVDAVGGTITYDGDYRIHTFTVGGNLVVNSGNALAWYLVIAGGSGGGMGDGGGGAAGGYRENGVYDMPLAPGNYPVVVGLGGAGSVAIGAKGADGQDSSFNGIVATKGGGAGSYTAGAIANGNPGGSGGGGAGVNPAGVGGAAVPAGQGNPGGTAYYAAPNYPGGGGGGADEAGTTATANNPGYGGKGKVSSITGQPVRRAAGGSGGAYLNQATPGPWIGGGDGGGGHGAMGALVGGAAQPNTGSGGGGGGYGSGGAFAGGPGSAGVVIVRYKYRELVQVEQGDADYEGGGEFTVLGRKRAFGSVTFEGGGEFDTFGTGSSTPTPPVSDAMRVGGGGEFIVKGFMRDKHVVRTFLVEGGGRFKVAGHGHKITVGGGRLHRGRRPIKFLTPEELHAQHREWLGLPPEPTPEKLPAGYEYEIEDAIRVKVGGSAGIAAEFGAADVGKARLRGEHETEIDLERSILSAGVVTSATDPEVELEHDGEAQLVRLGTRSHVVPDLWLDRPVSEAEALEAIAKVKRLTKQ